MTVAARETIAAFRPGDMSLTVVGDADQFERIAPLHLRFGPNLLRTRIDGLSLREPPPPLELSESDCVLIAKLEHEIDHLHRHLATSYGLLLHMIHSRQIDLFFRAVDSLAASEKLRLPLDDNAAESLHRDHLFQLLREYADLAEMLTGGSTRVLRLSPEERERAASRLVSDLLRQSERRWPHHDADDKFWSGDSLEVPSVQCTVGRRFRDCPLGAHGILEYLGLSREISLRRSARVAYEATSSFIRVPAYQQIGQFWKRHFPAESHQDARSPLPEEFYLACDLALWIPCGPHGLIPANVEESRKLTWADLSPGLRFRRIVEFLARGGIVTPPRSRLDAVFQQEFVARQDEICHALGWATPAAIARQWLEYLQEAMRKQSHDFRMIEDEWNRTEGAIQLLKGRLMQPGFAAVGYWAASNQQSLWFQACTVERSAAHESTMFLSPTAQERQAEFGYHLPPSFAVTSCLDLFARKRDERLMGEDLLAQYQRIGRKMQDDVSLYSKRHYGFRITFGRE